MKRYIIEVEDGKIFSYATAGLRLMRPHGDKFYSAKKLSAYLEWFTEETAVDELDICFIYSDDSATIEQIKNTAQKFPHAEKSTWQMTELKNFFRNYRDEQLKENFRWDENLRQIIFDNGKIFKVDGLSDLILEAEKISTPHKKFKIKVYTPPEKSIKNSELEIMNEDSPLRKSSKPLNLPAEFQEKISANDLQKYIEEQTSEQCDKVSFRSQKACS